MVAKRKSNKEDKSVKAKKFAKSKPAPIDVDRTSSSDDGEDLMDAAHAGKYGESDQDEADSDWEVQSNEDDPIKESDKPKKGNAKGNTKSSSAEVASGEIEGLKETAELYKSNLFKLEMNELLKAVNVDYNKHKTLEKALHHLKYIFDNITEGKEQTLHEFESTMMTKNKIATPFPSPRPTADMHHKFKFEKPTELKIVGSYALKSLITVKKQFSIDVVVTMPKNTFQEKDYMNNRYFYKRACYLAVLASAIINAKKGFQVEYSTLGGDLRRPILLVKASGDKGELDFTKTKCTIRILPNIANDVFPIHRLAPGKSNIRQLVEPVTESSEPTSTSTPMYNASILYETTYLSNLAFLYQHSKTCPEFKDAAKLIKIWAYQRGLAYAEQNSSGVNTFLLSMIMGYLLQGGGHGGGRKLLPGHSSYQLLRGTLDFIAHHDFAKEPILIGQSNLEEFSVEAFTANYPIVIVDSSGTLNLAAHITPSGFSQLRHEAKLAMSLMDDSTDRFESLFLKKVDDDLLRYDQIAKFTVPKTEIKQYDAHAKVDCPSYIWFCAKTLGSILTRGLSDRVHLVAIQYDVSVVWPIGSSIPDTGKKASITVGLVLNPDTALRLVDRGPDEQDKEASKEFNDFWGPKAELRRFKDGSIIESVVWEAKGYENRSLIIKEIILYLLKLHIGVDTGKIRYWAGQVYPFISLSKAVPDRFFSAELALTPFEPVLNAFTAFSKRLQELYDTLPIMMGSAISASPCLRYASVIPPQPVDFDNIGSYPTAMRYFDAIDVNVQLERSPKWPSDLTAMQKVKHAFYLKISEEFQANFGIRSTVVDCAEERNPLAIRGYLDVFYGGFVFRCHLYVEQEGELLRVVIKKPEVDSRQKELATKALEKYERLVIRQRHSFTIQPVCTRYTALSPTIRLVKRWFGTHLLSTQVAEEVIELLCAHVFAEPYPWQTATSALTGFARVLQLLATWNWKEAPLIVDPQNELSAEDRDNIVRTFTQYRTVNPQMTRRIMYIATANDPIGKNWADRKPSFIVTERIRMLAKASFDALEHALATDQEDGIKQLFVTPMQDYNVVIHLNPTRCTRYYQSLYPEKKYLPAMGTSVSELGDEAYAQLDTAGEFVREIEETYKDVLMVFHDKFGGDKIALVWNPAIVTPKPFKVSADYNNVPVDMTKGDTLKPAQGKDAVSKLIVPNYSAILAEIERLGAGLIKKIEKMEKA